MIIFVIIVVLIVVHMLIFGLVVGYYMTITFVINTFVYLLVSVIVR